jgi:small-conductance mechanosensitive channel
LAEAVISSPRIKRESIDAHLIRIFTRLLALAIALLFVGSDMLGLHAYGIIAGLGVGGLVIALAAQSTVENLIGGLSLFADRPVRVGDFCKYGEEVRQWRAAQKLPFPDFDVEFRQTHRDTLDYPPAGSSTAAPKTQG